MESSEEIQHQNLVQLNFIKLYLDEIQFRTHLLEKTVDIPTHSLIACGEQDYKNRDLIMNLMYIPMHQEDKQDIVLLQIHIQLPISQKIEKRQDIESLILQINPSLALGNFGIRDGCIFFRYMHAAGIYEKIQKEVITEIVLMCNFIVVSFIRIIEDIATGKITLSEAIQNLEQ